MTRRNTGMGAQDYIDLQNRRARGKNGARNVIVAISLTATFLYIDTQTSSFRKAWQNITNSPAISVPYIYRAAQLLKNNLK